MQSSSEGVVLVSFGSVGKSIFMPEATRRAFLEAFSHFPNVTFLWKYERPEDNIAAGHPNVVLVDWVPQIDLLGESGSQVHCGIGSCRSGPNRRSFSEQC